MEKRVYIKTYGCQMNERESESLGAILESWGYGIAGDEHSADIILLNTCSVRERAEAKAIGKSNLIVRGKNGEKLVGILGCMAQNFGEALLQKSPHTRLIVGPNAMERIPEYLDQLILDRHCHIVDREIRSIDKNFAAAHDQSQLRPSMFVGIMQGCNMRCTYCIVPRTRGPEQYRPMEDIVDEIRWLGERGTREIILLGQIVNRYGMGKMPMINGKSPFVQLLEKIHGIDGIRRIGFMSPHPTGFKADLIDAYSHLPKLCSHVHLPLQSGSNTILRAMKRPYTRGQFLTIVDALRKKVPSLSLSTDIIVGFPGETEEDFRATCDLFDEIKFDMAFIFKYSPRPDTVAAELDNQIPREIKEERNQILLKKVECYSREYNAKMVGKVKEVLVERPTKRGLHQFEGHTAERKKVIFTGNGDLIGKIINVRIEDYTTATLLGKIV